MSLNEKCINYINETFTKIIKESENSLSKSHRTLNHFMENQSRKSANLHESLYAQRSSSLVVNDSISPLDDYSISKKSIIQQEKQKVGGQYPNLTNILDLSLQGLNLSNVQDDSANRSTYCTKSPLNYSMLGKPSPDSNSNLTKSPRRNSVLVNEIPNEIKESLQCHESSQLSSTIATIPYNNKIELTRSRSIDVHNKDFNSISHELIYNPKAVGLHIRNLSGDTVKSLTQIQLKFLRSKTQSNATKDYEYRSLVEVDQQKYNKRNNVNPSELITFQVNSTSNYRNKKTSMRMDHEQSIKSLVQAQNHKCSESFVQRMLNHEQARIYAKKFGSIKYQSTKQNKNLNEQILALENRIKRLQLEEDLMKKRIEDTTKKTNKILDNKQRHKEKLENKFQKMYQDENYLQKKKESLNNKRFEDKNFLKHVLDRTLQEKRDIVNSVKIENQFGKMIKNEINKKIAENNQVKIAEIKNLENNLKSARIEKENAFRDTYKYIEKLEKDRQESTIMEQKLNDLEKIEQVLLERLSNSYMVQKAKYHELEKAYHANIIPKDPRDTDKSKTSSASTIDQ